MSLLRGLVAGLALSAGVAAAQPAVPPPRQTPPIQSWMGPMLIPLIVGTAALIALVAYVVWRMVVRVRRRQRPPRPEL